MKVPTEPKNFRNSPRFELYRPKSLLLRCQMRREFESPDAVVTIDFWANSPLSDHEILQTPFPARMHQASQHRDSAYL